MKKQSILATSDSHQPSHLVGSMMWFTLSTLDVSEQIYLITTWQEAFEDNMPFMLDPNADIRK
jgi:hypothetical protein